MFHSAISAPLCIYTDVSVEEQPAMKCVQHKCLNTTCCSTNVYVFSTYYYSSEPVKWFAVVCYVTIMPAEYWAKVECQM